MVPHRNDPGNLGIFIENQAHFIGFLRRYVESQAAAEDLLQQALLQSLKHAGDWEGKENILAWFYRILRNVLIDHYRSRASERRKEESLELEPRPEGEERAALCACFEGLIGTLKPEYAQVLRRVDLHQEDPAAVAAELGVTPNNLGVRLHRARQALRKSLETTCGVCTRHGCLDCTCRESHPASHPGAP